jgi:hypothetical protein
MRARMTASRIFKDLQRKKKHYWNQPIRTKKIYLILWTHDSRFIFLLQCCPPLVN